MGRGVEFIQVPTTLLAMVDSSVGGKTGVNHPLGKNMLGAFHQPQAVIIDTESLNTLADKEYFSGLAEVVKYGLIRDAPFLEWMEQNWDRVLSRDPEALAYAVKRSCENKAEIVAADEREGGVRASCPAGIRWGAWPSSGAPRSAHTHSGRSNPCAQRGRSPSPSQSKWPLHAAGSRSPSTSRWRARRCALGSGSPGRPPRARRRPRSPPCSRRSA